MSCYRCFTMFLKNWSVRMWHYHNKLYLCDIPLITSSMWYSTSNDSFGYAQYLRPQKALWESLNLWIWIRSFTATLSHLSVSERYEISVLRKQCVLTTMKRSEARWKFLFQAHLYYFHPETWRLKWQDHACK